MTFGLSRSLRPVPMESGGRGRLLCDVRHRESIVFTKRIERVEVKLDKLGLGQTMPCVSFSIFLQSPRGNLKILKPGTGCTGNFNMSWQVFSLADANS